MEIYLSILKTVQKEGYVKPTWIMYRSNLTWRSLQRILQSMIDNNLVGFVEESGRKLFYITDEGKKAVEILEKAYSIVAKIVAKINGY